MREVRQHALVRLQRSRQVRVGGIRPAPDEPDHREGEDRDADGLVAREHGQLLHAQRKIVGDEREGDLYRNQHDDQPMQQLSDGSPAGDGISDRHGTKLKRVTVPFKSPAAEVVCAWTAGRARLRAITVLSASMLAMLLAGCPSGSRPVPGPQGQTVPKSPVPATSAPPASAQGVMPHVGRPYDVVPGESLITILAYRGGALAKAGHNHVIASHDFSGTIYVPEELARTSVQVRIPVEGLTVDEAPLRAKEGPDFAAAVPDSAKEGTRHNMLSEALLSAAGNPEILLDSQSLEGAGADTGAEDRAGTGDRAGARAGPGTGAGGSDASSRTSG